MDTVALPLSDAIRVIENAGRRYTITKTAPDRVKGELYQDCLYVLRQTEDNEGVCHLIVAAKMGKEVC